MRGETREIETEDSPRTGDFGEKDAKSFFQIGEFVPSSPVFCSGLSGSVLPV